MKNGDLTVIYTPMGNLDISLRRKCFHDGTPPVAIIFDWYYEITEYGIENGWEFTLECLEIWLRTEYPNNAGEIIFYIKQFKEGK